MNLWCCSPPLAFTWPPAALRSATLCGQSGLPPIVYLPGVFCGFLFILTIKLRKHPFDLSTSHHAHQEMVKGLTTEFNGVTLLIVEVSHWYENVFLMGIIALFFINGKPWSYALAAVAVVLSYFWRFSLTTPTPASSGSVCSKPLGR